MTRNSRIAKGEQARLKNRRKKRVAYLFGGTKLAHRGSGQPGWPLIVIFGVIGSAIGAVPGDHGGKEQRVTSKEMTVWEVVAFLGSRLPLRPAGVEQLFNVKLRKTESSNRFVTFWEGKDAALKDGLLVTRIVLGTRNDNPGDPGILTFNISNACQTLDEIRSRFGELVLTGTPSGQSEDEEMTYETKMPWGKLIFGFAERSPGCLSSVGLAPGK